MADGSEQGGAGPIDPRQIIDPRGLSRQALGFKGASRHARHPPQRCRVLAEYFGAPGNEAQAVTGGCGEHWARLSYGSDRRHRLFARRAAFQQRDASHTERLLDVIEQISK